MADNISPPVGKAKSASPCADASADDRQASKSRTDAPKQIMDAKEFWDRLER